MNTKRDEFLTEQVLGECWHEWDLRINYGAVQTIYCKHCDSGMEDRIDFSTPVGFFKLWNAAKEKDWYYSFWQKIALEDFEVGHHFGGMSYWEPLIHPDHLADALEAFLKERK